MAGRRMGAGGGGRGGPPGGINYQGKRWFENKPTSQGKISGINYALHGKSSGFYQCMRLAHHVPARMRKGFCANRYKAATGVFPGQRHGRRGGGR